MIAKGKARELSLFRVATVDQGKVLFASARLSGEKVRRFAHKKRFVIDDEKTSSVGFLFFVPPCRFDGRVWFVLRKMWFKMRWNRPFLHILGVCRCRCRLLFRCAKSGNVFSQIWIDVVEKFVLGVFYRDKKGLFSWWKELHLTITKVSPHERKRRVEDLGAGKSIVGRIKVKLEGIKST